MIKNLYKMDSELTEEEKEISFICSLDANIEETDAKYVIDSEIIRQNQLYNKSELIDNRNTNKTEKQLEEDNLKRTL